MDISFFDYCLKEKMKAKIQAYAKIFVNGINDGSATKENEPFHISAEKFFKGIGYYNHDFIQSIRPNHSSTRMIMQQGLFVVPDQLNENQILDKFDKLCTKIVIDKSLRSKALKYLSKRGFDSTRLMPDLDGLRSFLNNKY